MSERSRILVADVGIAVALVLVAVAVSPGVAVLGIGAAVVLVAVGCSGMLGRRMRHRRAAAHRDALRERRHRRAR